MINDGDAVNANVALGGKFADGKGHAAVYLDYRKIDALTKAAPRLLQLQCRSRRWTALYCGGSSTQRTRRLLRL